MLDEEKFYGLLDFLNKTLPDEINQSKEIVFTKDRILNDANCKLSELLENAEARARLMTSEHEVIKKLKLQLILY